MFNYIKTVFTKPKEIYTARNMKNSHYFSLIFIIGLILTFFSIFEMFPIANQVSDDYEEINTSIPDFKLEDGQLESDTGSYIYQTNSIMFYFDSEDRITVDKIESNIPTQAAPISIGLLKDEIYLNAANTGYSFSYNDFKDLNAGNLMEALDSMGNFTIGMYVLLIIILLVVNLFIYITQLLPISLFANLISVFRKTRLSFLQNAKIALLASMGPFILMAIFNALQIQVAYQYEITLFTSLILFYISITEMKKRLGKQKKSD